MSHLSTALKSTLDERGWSQKDACVAFGLPPGSGTLSQYLSDARTPNTKQLSQILAALDETAQARILIAVMRDQIPSEKYRSLVVLTDATTSTTLRDEALESWRRIPLPEDLRRDAEVLLEAAKTDPDIANLIHAAAAIIPHK